MHFAMCANRATEAGADFVITQIKMGAALAARRRIDRGINFLSRFAFKTFDDRAALRFPETFDLVHDRRFLARRGRSRFQLARRAEFYLNLFRGRWNKSAAALPAHRAFDGSIFHLLEAAVRTFHT